MPSSTSLRRCSSSLLLLSALLGLACSSGSTAAPAPPPPSTVGTAGGTVSEPGGASVVVPPGALSADVTIQIAKDATGAPPLPAELSAAGATYVITPHGGEFAQPVEVRIPAPAVTLQPNQELKLAKAQPGGEWVVLGETQLAGGVLSAQVGDFSFFMPVTVSYVLPLLQLAPLQVSSSLDCGDQPCPVAVGTVTATYTVTTNSGQLPSNCLDGSLAVQGGQGTSLQRYGSGITGLPLGGGTVSRTLAPRRYGYNFATGLRCSTFAVTYSWRSVGWMTRPAYPGLAFWDLPRVLDVVDGSSATLDVVLQGGASRDSANQTQFAAATPDDHAVMDWERSDDGGASWRLVARSYQDDADPRPVTGAEDWRYWSVRHGFIASAADQDALIRVRACYTPPDADPPPCVTGPTTRLNVVQQGAPPTITTQPAGLTVVAGSDAAFAVAALGAGTLGYQWSHDGTPIPGATDPVLRLPAVTAADAGAYGVVVSSAGGTVASDAAILTVTPGGSAPVPPAIVAQPADATVVEGSTATFTVAATGSDLRYQWERDGAPIPGATATSYTTPALTVGDHGATFAVLVYNAAGLVPSQAARLTVNGLTPPGMALFVGNFVLGGGGGAADATGLDARLDTPTGLVADPAGNLYVAEANIPLVAKVAPDGVVTTLYQHTHSVTALALGPDGSLYVGAACGMPRLLPPLVAGAVNQPVQTGYCAVGQVGGITVDDAGAVLVSLPSGNAIYGFADSGGVAGYFVFAGAPNVYISPGTSDGNGTAARFDAQQGMVRGADGTLYVADTGNQTIRKVTPAGDVTTWIGAPGVPGTVDGNGTAARLYRPTQLAFDAVGNLFVLTQGDPAAPVALVRRITPAGDVTTVFNATAEVLAIATVAEAPWASTIRGLAVIGTNQVALTAGNAIVLRTLR